MDSEKKDPRFSNCRYWSWDRLKEELKECVLLCSCCHNGVHSGDLDLGVAKSGLAPVLGTGERRFKSSHPDQVC